MELVSFSAEGKGALLNQLLVPPGAAGESVVAGDGADELADLGAQARAPERGARLPTPVEAPGLPVPADNGLGLDDQEVVAP